MFFTLNILYRMIHVQYHVEFYNTVQYHTIQFRFIE